MPAAHGRSRARYQTCTVAVTIPDPQLTEPLGTPIHRTLLLYFFFFFVFLGLHPQHMEIPGLGVELELQLPAYTRATATPDPSHVCDLHHSSQQLQFLKPLSEARRTHNLMDASWIRFHFATTETPNIQNFRIKHDFILIYSSFSDVNQNSPEQNDPLSPPTPLPSQDC